MTLYGCAMKLSILHLMKNVFKERTTVWYLLKKKKKNH